jgi:hypothetical protein
MNGEAIADHALLLVSEGTGKGVAEPTLVEG